MLFRTDSTSPVEPAPERRTIKVSFTLSNTSMSVEGDMDDVRELARDYFAFVERMRDEALKVATMMGAGRGQ